MQIEHNEEYSSYYSFVDQSPSMKQHGIKGQKWGVRRYQYKDGSLTPDGRIRYGYGFKKGKNGERKFSKSASEQNSKRELDYDTKVVRWMEWKDEGKPEFSEKYLLDNEKDILKKLEVPTDFLTINEKGEVVRKDGRKFEAVYKGKVRTYESLYDIAEDYEYFKNKNETYESFEDSDKGKFTVIYDNPSSKTFNSTLTSPMDSDAHIWNYFDKNYDSKVNEFLEKAGNPKSEKELNEIYDKAYDQVLKDFYNKEVIERTESARQELSAYKTEHKQDSLKDKKEKAAYSLIFTHPEYYTDSSGQWRYQGENVTLEELIKKLSNDKNLSKFINY